MSSIVSKKTSLYEDIIRSYAHSLSSCEIKAWKKFRPERDSDQ